MYLYNKIKVKKVKNILIGGNMNNIGRSIVSIIGVIVFSLILIVSSKFIFKGGFLSDKYNNQLNQIQHIQNSYYYFSTPL